MKKNIVILFLIVSIGLVGLYQNMNGQTNTKQLTELIQKGAYLVDVRTPQEFAEGHVDGSINIPLDQVQQQLSKFKGKKNVIVFCRSGNRSGQAKAILEQNGITNVTNGGTWQTVNQCLKTK